MEKTPQQRTIDVLKELQELNDDNKTEYIVLEVETLIGFYDKSRSKCKEAINKLSNIKKKTHNLNIVSLLDEIIQYYESVITMLVLTDEGYDRKPEYEPVIVDYFSSMGGGKSNFNLMYMMEQMKAYNKIMYFNNEQGYDEIARNLDRTHQLRSLGQRSNKHNSKIWG